MFLDFYKLKDIDGIISSSNYDFYNNNKFYYRNYYKKKNTLTFFRKNIFLANFFLKQLNYFCNKKIKNTTFFLVIFNRTIDSFLNLNSSLSKYYGVGFFISNWFSYLGGSLPYVLLGNFLKEGILVVSSKITTFKIDEVLKKVIKNNYLLWRDLYHFHSLRKKKGLPIRGQRTKSNSKTPKKKVFLNNLNLD